MPRSGTTIHNPRAYHPVAARTSKVRGPRFTCAGQGKCATVAAMKYLTKTEYARLKGISRQAVNDRIKRKKLHLVPVKTEVLRIPVEDTELAAVN